MPVWYWGQYCRNVQRNLKWSIQRQNSIRRKGTNESCWLIIPVIPGEMPILLSLKT
jgi:hypothetical protein